MWAQRFWHSGCSKVDLGSEFPARSPTLNERRCPDLAMWWHGDWVSLALGVEVLNPQCCGARPLGLGHTGADLGLGLAPRRPADLS